MPLTVFTKSSGKFMSCVYPIFINEKIIEICQVTYVQLAREIQRLQIIQIAKSSCTVTADRAGGGNAGGGPWSSGGPLGSLIRQVGCLKSLSIGMTHYCTSALKKIPLLSLKLMIACRHTELFCNQLLNFIA